MKYNKGDLVTIMLSEDVADLINRKASFYLENQSVVKHEPAPFDWKDVKPGMAFRNSLYSLFYFIGFDHTGRYVFDMQKSNHNGRYSSFGIGTEGLIEASITRAPEHDIEVKDAD